MTDLDKISSQKQKGKQKKEKSPKKRRPSQRASKRTSASKDDDGDEADERKKKATIFWETIHAYGGAKDCWTALEVALTKTEDIALAREILNASGMKVCHKNALACFDERGFLYSIPRYALAVKTVSTPA